MSTKTQKFQVFIQFPELQIPTQALSFENPNPNFTLQDLKSSLFPKTRQNLRSLYFTLNGKPLSDSTKLPNSQIAPLSTLTLRCRLLGGGGDGGATGAESRDCYLNMYAAKKPDKVDPNETRLSKWLNCAISNEPLKRPVVIDKLGNLFNKEALVEALLMKKLPKEFWYIRGLKDMIAVELDVIPGSEDERGSRSGAKFQCPISGLEFNGKYKFFALRSCGHVLSAKALKEVKSPACLVCRKDFSESDKMPINGNEEEVAVLRERMEAERINMKDKKVKKVKTGGLVANGDEDGSVGLPKLSGTKRGIDTKVESDKASAKVEGNSKLMATGKVETNRTAKRFKAVDAAPANATKEVYASIFTSSRRSDFKETFTCRSLPLGRN